MAIWPLYAYSKARDKMVGMRLDGVGACRWVLRCVGSASVRCFIAPDACVCPNLAKCGGQAKAGTVEQEVVDVLQQWLVLGLM